MRKRREISSGDHHSSSHSVTWPESFGWASFGVLGRLAQEAARSWARQAR